MRKTFYLLLLISISFTAFSQYPGGGQGRPGGRAGGQSMNIGHFYGKVVDKKHPEAYPPLPCNFYKHGSTQQPSNQKTLL